MKFSFWYLGSLILGLVGFGCQMNIAEQTNERNRPNIVFILTDDQGWGDLSLTGNENLETPNIDRLADHGAFFNQFFVSPVCSPTRAEILTGRYYPRSGVYETSEGGERIDLDETLISEYFQEAGYQTAAFGKWHSGSQGAYHPMARGFDHFYGFCSGHWGNYFDPMLEDDGKWVRGKGFITDDLTEKAIEFMVTNRDRPFFLYLPYNAPHGPMQVPEKWWNPQIEQPLKMAASEGTEEIPFTKAALAMCENIDWNVGRITQTIDSLALTDQTIIIFLTDNGPNSWRWNDGLKGKKGSTDEGGVRSPLILSNPILFPHGKVISLLSSAPDLFPTLLSLANIPLHSSQKPLDGMDLMPYFNSEPTHYPYRMIVSHWKNRVSIRDPNYRLDHNDQLYSINQDPGQKEPIEVSDTNQLSRLKNFKVHYQNEIMTETPQTDNRPFTIGHPDIPFDYLPARDASFSGGIRRSNRWPNCSYLTQWTSIEDQISWNVHVLTPGSFDIFLHYTCTEPAVGSQLKLTSAQTFLTFDLKEGHNPPLRGHENDRVPRQNSYVKDFKSLHLGHMELKAGPNQLTLSASTIRGDEVADIRMIALYRKERN